MCDCKNCQGVGPDFEDEDEEMELECPECGTVGKNKTCELCGLTEYIIDCGHYDQPAHITGGKKDGSDLGTNYCEECANRIEELEVKMTEEEMMQEIDPTGTMDADRFLSEEYLEQWYVYAKQESHDDIVTWGKKHDPKFRKNLIDILIDDFS